MEEFGRQRWDITRILSLCDYSTLEIYAMGVRAEPEDVISSTMNRQHELLKNK